MRFLQLPCALITAHLDNLPADECCARLVLSFATPEEHVQKFVGLVKRLGN